MAKIFTQNFLFSKMENPLLHLGNCGNEWEKTSKNCVWFFGSTRSNAKYRTHKFFKSKKRRKKHEMAAGKTFDPNSSRGDCEGDFENISNLVTGPLAQEQALIFWDQKTLSSKIQTWTRNYVNLWEKTRKEWKNIFSNTSISQFPI